MKNLVLAAMLAVLASGCVLYTSTRFSEYHGPDADKIGTGGTKRVVKGMDVWSNGDPDRPFRVLGLISQNFRNNGSPMAAIAGLNREAALVAEARKQGGDAIIYIWAQSKNTGLSGKMDNYGNIRTRSTSRTAFEVVVIKYLPKDQYTPVPSSRPTQSPVVQETAGTGWYCSSNHIVTCWHILEGRSIFYALSGVGPRVPLRLVVRDPYNDLAVLETPRQGVALHSSLPILSRSVDVAEDVFTTGFPHPDLLGRNPKYAEGSVSAKSGIDDDPRVLQISVPVQAGNSGGPLMSSCGGVVGIITSKLAAARVYAQTGDLPQNVNYAVKAAYLRTLLDSKGIEYASQPSQPDTQRSDLVRDVNSAIVQIIAQ